MINSDGPSRPEVRRLHPTAWRLIRCAAVLGASVALAVTGTAADAAATKQETVDIQGRLILQSDHTYRSTGDFLGTYRLIREDPVFASWTVGQTTINVIGGIDEMTGCLDLNRNGKCDDGGPRGTIKLAFKRLSTFDKDGTFIESNCTHPITDVTNVGGRRSDDFVGGLIFMADRARDGQGGDIKSTYRGEITVIRR